MNTVSQQTHHRAIAVAVAGIFFGTLSQAYLIEASVRTHSSASSELGVTAGRPVRSYHATDLSRACAAAQNRAQRAVSGTPKSPHESSLAVEVEVPDHALRIISN
jgi:hypothetical protein